MTRGRLFMLLISHKASGWDWSPLPFLSPPGAVSLHRAAGRGGQQPNSCHHISTSLSAALFNLRCMFVGTCTMTLLKQLLSRNLLLGSWEMNMLFNNFNVEFIIIYPYLAHVSLPKAGYQRAHSFSWCLYFVQKKCTYRWANNPDSHSYLMSVGFQSEVS